MDEASTSVATGEREPRRLAAGVAIPAATLAAGLALFHLWTAFAGAYPNLVQRGIHLGTAFVLGFVLYPAGPWSPRRRPSVIDAGLAVAAVAVFGYVIVQYEWIIDNPATSTPVAVVLGGAAVVLVVEIGRRTVGATFALLVVLAVVYAVFGGRLPGGWAHRGLGATSLAETLYLSTLGIMGPVTGVSATLVAVFLVFGALLYHTGGGEAFVDFAKWLAGRSYGGPAKVSVVSSALFGTISGSAVANVVVDGIFNIPLMKSLGYRREFAAAVEATASSGGQIVPPVMGAGAFIMADLLGIPYLQVALAAAIPAALYYVGCGAAIHFEARRTGLRPLPPDAVPAMRTLLPWRRWAPLVAPVSALIVLMLLGRTPALATFWASVVSVAVFLASTPSALGLLARMRDIGRALAAGGRAIVLVAALVAAAQVIIAVINATGIGVKLSELIMNVSAGRLLVALGLAMVVCIVLGMGLPTTAAYVLAASVVGPALIQLGAAPLAAHMFVFYFAIISAITPPVCAAVFVAAAIARANWVSTAWIAVRLGAAGFIVPYMFVFSPELLLQAPGMTAVWAAITALVGVVALSAGVMGHLRRTARPLERALLVVGALLLIKPGPVTDVLGAGAVAVTWLLQRRDARVSADAIQTTDTSG